MLNWPLIPIDNLKVSISLGANGDGYDEPNGLPNHMTGTPNGFPATPGIIKLLGLRYDKAGYEGDCGLSLTFVDAYIKSASNVILLNSLSKEKYKFSWSSSFTRLNLGP